jgi:hypothetical protein
MIYTQRMTSIMMTTMINIGRRCNNDIDGGVDVSGTKIQHNRKISWRHTHLSIVQVGGSLDHGEPRTAIESE